MTEKHYYKWDEEKQICTGYIRFGECVKCGTCCKAHIVYRVAGDVAMQDRKNGGRRIIPGIGIWSEINSGDERTFFETIKIVLESDHCKGLDENNLCNSHEENKAICAEWPFNPTDLKHFPNCGYSFEEDGKWTYKEIEEKRTVKS